jgi:hypothetical protein
VRQAKAQELTDRMKFFLFTLLFLSLVACGNHQKLNAYSGYVKEISNSDSTINELAAVSDSEELNGRLNARFQSISVNKELYSKNPEERVQEKSELFDECLAFFDSCSYVPEGYSFAINKQFLNLKYQYNAFGSNDLFYKHAVINLATGRKLVYLNMFTDPNQVLERFNAKYVKENEDYLASFANTDLSENEQEEYDVIRNHLDSRVPFQLHELNNCELFFDAKKRRFTEIRFHYNGSSGVYKSILTEAYISLTLKEFKDLLAEDFKDQMGKL